MLFSSATTLPSSQLSTLSLHDALPIFLDPGVKRQRGGRASVAGTEEAHLDDGRPDLDEVDIATVRRKHRADTVKRRFDALVRSEEHTSELQSPCNIVCRLLLENKNA